ncbi:MAG: hypothetical protein LBT91_00815, partial [Bifidobacteriaceae bacterium]|nr:hypothetical protein [Bifidobacteriaceae bacterium]
TGLVTVVGAGTYTVTSHIDGCADVTSTSQTATAPQIATVVAGQNLPIAGGAATLTGTSLGGISKISVDGDEVREWSVKSDTELAIVVPAHTAGDVPLQISGYWSNTVVTEDVTYA